MRSCLTSLATLALFSPCAWGQLALSDEQRDALNPCLQETDNLRRLLCFDLALGVTVETAWSDPAGTTTEAGVQELAFPPLSAVLNTLEAARPTGALGWQFALHAPRLDNARLPGVLYGPGDLFTKASSLYWPTPSAVLQTGVEIFASQAARQRDGVDDVAAPAYLVATCANEFPALTLALNTPVKNATYVVQEAYPSGQISQSVWRSLEGGLVLEMARGLPALQAMEAMRVPGFLTLSYLESGQEVFLTFDTSGFADVATSIAYTCNAPLLQPEPPQPPPLLPPQRPAARSEP